MRKKLFTLLLAFWASIGTMNAVKIGSLYYYLNDADKTANVIKPEDGSIYDLVNVSIPSSVTYAYEGQESVTYTVEGIARYAFEDCTSLTSLTLPNTIKGMGDEAFCRCTGLTSVIIPNSVTYMGWSVFSGCTNLASIELSTNLSEIGLRCFADCKSLTSITIPSSLEYIEMVAFTGCSSLVSVTIPEGVKKIGDSAFKGCSSLIEIIIPNSVTEIEASAFRDCESLASVTIGKGVTTIGDYAFTGCNNIKAVYISDLTKWCGIQFSDNPLSYGKHLYLNGIELTDLIIPNTITSINHNSFENCLSIQTVKMGSDVTEIQAYAFYGCANMTSVSIGENVKTIKGRAFCDCSSLREITIPNNVTQIGELAFASCDSLVSVTIGRGVQSISTSSFSTKKISSVTWNAKNCNAYAFGSQVETFTFGDEVEIIPSSLCSGMKSLTSIIIPNSVTSIGSSAFSGCSGLIGGLVIPNSVTSIENSTFSGCKGLTSVTIPNGITSIGSNAFSGCSGLIGELVIPNGVTSIGSSAFSGCSGLIGELVIPNGVTSIGNYAFRDCSGLTSVTIPNSVTKIGDYAFRACGNLKSIRCEAVNPPQLGSNVFYGVDKIIPLYVPEESIETYKATGQWKNFKNIFSLDETAHIVCFYDCDEQLLEKQVVKDGETATAPSTSANKDRVILSWDMDFTNVTTDMSIYSNCAYGGTCGADLTWVLTSDSILTISGTGAMDTWSQGSNVPWYTYRSMIKEVSLPEGLTVLGKYAFYSCSNLELITITDNVTSIGSSAFYGCSKLKSINIPENTTSVGQAFSGCSALTTIVWNAKQHSDFTTSSNAPFYNIRANITSFIFGDEVQNIPANLCYEMSNVTSVTIPNSVTSIGSRAFSGCSNLTSLYNYSVIPQTISSNVFTSVLKSTCVLYVPAESLAAYKAANVWKDFLSIRAIGGKTYYTVTFVDWNNTILKSEQVEEGQSATTPADPTREGYTFTGWDKDFSNVTNNMTVTAQYKINRYAVTFVDWDEAILKKDSVDYGSAATAPADPEREGYTFTGWDKDFSNVTENMIIMALYEQETTPQSHVFLYDLTAIGMTISDWTVNNATLNEQYSTNGRYAYDIVGGDVSLAYVTAEPRIQFQYTNSADKANAFFIYPSKCFEFNGRDGILRIHDTAIGDTIRLNVAAKGSNAANFEGTGYPVNATALTEDLVLPAKNSEGADANGYVWRTLEYVSQGGDVEIKEFSAGYRLRLIEIVEGQSNPQPASLHVSFYDWDGTLLKTDTVDYGSAATAPADPEREGYTFTGWDKDFSNVTEDMTVTALYEKQEPIGPEIITTRDILDLSVDGITINDWTINDATLNEAESNVSQNKYAFDVKGGIPSIDYVTSKPRFQFQYGNSADKTKAFFIYPGRFYETGGKNGLILISNTQKGDTIKLDVAAKGSTAGNFLDPNGTYPINATALTADLTLPAKGSPGADANGYTWRTLEYLSQGGDVTLKEVGGGYRIRLAEVVHVESPVTTGITSAEGYQDTSVQKILRDGQLFILRGDKTYTVQGQEVK